MTSLKPLVSARRLALNSTCSSDRRWLISLSRVWSSSLSRAPLRTRVVVEILEQEELLGVQIEGLALVVDRLDPLEEPGVESRSRRGGRPTAATSASGSPGARRWCWNRSGRRRPAIPRRAVRPTGRAQRSCCRRSAARGCRRWPRPRRSAAPSPPRRRARNPLRRSGRRVAR